MNRAAPPLGQVQRWMHEALRAPGGDTDARLEHLEEKLNRGIPNAADT